MNLFVFLVFFVVFRIASVPSSKSASITPDFKFQISNFKFEIPILVFALVSSAHMSFARRMENEMAPTPKRTEARPYLMDAKSVAYLLAPCILFTVMAFYSIINAIDFANMPQGKEMVERHRKDAEIRKIVAANIAAGDPFPSRELMLKELDDRDEKMRAWEDIVVSSATCMRQMGVSVLLGVAAQFYVVFKLRAHIKKLAGAATALPQNGTSL